MPTYAYLCTACGEEHEFFHNISTVKRKCPACGKLKLKKLIGNGSGIIFKGTGFYETDYKRKGEKPNE
jgi:putative FmdB family regulatory protein